MTQSRTIIRDRMKQVRAILNRVRHKCAKQALAPGEEGTVPHRHITDFLNATAVLRTSSCRSSAAGKPYQCRFTITDVLHAYHQTRRSQSPTDVYPTESKMEAGASPVTPKGIHLLGFYVMLGFSFCEGFWVTFCCL